MGTGKRVRALLWWAPVGIVGAAFLASLPWLEEMGEAVNRPIGTAVALFLMGWGIFLSTRATGSLDEVQVAGQRFAQAKGALAGTLVAVLLLFLPGDWFTDLIVGVTTEPEKGEPIDRHTVGMAITFGVVLVVVLQAFGTAIAGAIWNRRLGGNARDGS